MKKINWPMVWKKMDVWFDDPKNEVWAQTQIKIQSLVESELRRKPKKGRRTK